ncbi:Heat shock Hsp70 protein [Rutstroemia sp. NJR-2017a BVV2]|nr:Heat shock Hsp70 protein [Rutstroemia sp. NJR-2017a BVV2]
MTKQRPRKRIKIDAECAELVAVDFGTSNLRMGFGNTNEERFKEIGNYPAAYGSYRPSTIAQAPSNIVYRKFEDRPAKVVGFGFCKPRVRYDDISVDVVKTPLLPDPQNYSYIYASQITAAKECLLDSVEQISEDFIKKAVEYAIKENYRRQPSKGWTIQEVERFRKIVQRAGCKREIWIYGESDCVVFANVSDIQHATRKNKVAVGVFDFGAGTTDITVSEIHFSRDRKSLEAIDELKESLGIAVGGNLFDERFGRVLHAKLDKDMSLEEDLYSKIISAKFPSPENCDEQATKNYKEEYPYSIPNSTDKFVLMEEDMNYIMKPPIAEICRRIVDHLSGVKLDVIVLSGGTSEIVHLRDSLEKILKNTGVLKSDRKIVYNPGHSTASRNTVVKGLFFLSRNRDLFQNRYACMSLAYVVRYKRIELSDKQNIPDADGQQEGFYDSTDRIMTKYYIISTANVFQGVCVPGGVQMIEIYYDIDANRTTLDLSPIDICTPNATTLYLQPILTGINIEKLEESIEGKRRVWVQLGFEVGMEIIVEVFWRYDGYKCTAETSEFSANCKHDILDDHLESLRSISEGRKAEIEKHEMERKAEMKRADTERADMEKKIAQMESDELARNIAAQMQNDFRVHVEDDLFADWPQTVDPKFLSLGRIDFSIE